MVFLYSAKNRARRLVLVAAVTLAFAALYSLACAPEDLGGPAMAHLHARSLEHAVAMLYFSVGNTVTMGYGDIFARSTKARLLVIAQIGCTLFIVFS